MVEGRPGERHPLFGPRGEQPVRGRVESRVPSPPGGKSRPSRLIGHDFYLPNLSLIDSVPHTSRYRNAGKLEFKKYGKLTVLPVPGSSVLKFGPETYKSFIPGTGCMTKIEDVKTERDCGAMCSEGLIPDAVALLSHADTEIWVAIEFRVSHPKTIEDVRKYATVDFPVMEISITDDIANAEDTRKSLAERITGTGHATRFAGREWLYSPAAKKILKRSWHIEAEPSAKPLRHKGTDLIRLETPLPAITVYAVKGAPTGETHGTTSTSHSARSPKRPSRSKKRH